MHLELDEQADELVLQPPKEDFFSCFGNMLSSFVTMVTAVDRLHALPFFQVRGVNLTFCTNWWFSEDLQLLSSHYQITSFVLGPCNFVPHAGMRPRHAWSMGQR